MPVLRKRCRGLGRRWGGDDGEEASLVQVAQKGAGGSGDGAHGTPRCVRNWTGKSLCTEKSWIGQKVSSGFSLTAYRNPSEPDINKRRRQWHPTPVLLSGKSHGWRSLVGCSPWGHEESNTTERLHYHFSLSCIGEGNGNPLQCSCLENPRDGGVWWAAVYAVAQSRTRLKRLSSSSSSRYKQGLWETQRKRGDLRLEDEKHQGKLHGGGERGWCYSKDSTSRGDG